MGDDNNKPKQSMEVPCSECKTTFVAVVPTPDVVNKKRFSLVVFPHDNFQKCPKCGASYQMLVTALAQVNIAWARVKDPGEVQIIKPPPGLKV